MTTRKKVIESGSLLTTIYESSTEDLQITLDLPQVSLEDQNSLENQNTTPDPVTQYSQESIVTFLQNKPIDCSYLLKSQSIEQNNPELLLSPIRQMFEKIDQQSQVDLNKFKAELNIAFTASQLEID